MTRKDSFLHSHQVINLFLNERNDNDELCRLGFSLFPVQCVLVEKATSRQSSLQGCFQWSFATHSTMYFSVLSTD